MSSIIEPIEEDTITAELVKVETAAGVNEDQAMTLRGEFADCYNEIIEWRGKAEMVTQFDDPTHQKIAREVRLGLRRVRCDVENTRKRLKADSLARGKALDGISNVLKYLCEPVEEKLLAVEQYAERQEAARIAAIVEERTAALVAVEADPTAYNLGAMDDDTFRLVLEAAKKRLDDRIEAERKAEADRIASEQADRIAREKAEKEAAAARAQAERERKAHEAFVAKAEKERKAAAEKARKEREAVEAKARAEREKAEAAARKAKAEADAKLRAEREAREKAERDAAASRKAEADRIAAEKAAEAARVKAEREAEEKTARAPDKEKIMAFAATVRNLTIPHCVTDTGKEACKLIDAKCGAFADWIEKQAEAL